MKILTLDIGGANTKKLVCEDGWSESSLHYFPVWKKREELSGFLKGLRGDADIVAITMTAELSDTFNSREEGAKFIVSRCEDTFEDPFFLSSTGSLLKKRDLADYRELGATNWLASRYVMEKRFDDGILLDIGSTTTDVFPFGKDVSRGFKSDMERLKASQLLYTGYLRTPINTIIREVPAGDSMISVASEFFAITADVYNVLWGVKYTCETPDKGGKSKEDSMRRLARLICADLEDVEGYIMDICRYVHSKQVNIIAGAVEKASGGLKNDTVYVAGVGKRLGIEAVESLGLRSVDIEKEVKDAWNLPGVGLAEMIIDMRGA